MKTKAFPYTQFSGFDTHDRLIVAARRIVREARIVNQVSFEVAGADGYAKRDYPLIASSTACTTWCGRAQVSRARNGSQGGGDAVQSDD
jgi:hypothetical protein